MLNSKLVNSIIQRACEKDIFFSCHFDLTYHCNLDCVHCYVCKQDRPELTTQEVKDLIDEIAEMGALYLTFSGGEVFTRQDFLDICRYARKKHFALQILTNGALIDEAIVDELVEIKPEYFSLSLYSMEPNIHDSITKVSGSCIKTIKAIELLRRKNFNVRIATIVMRENYRNYKKITEFAEKIGAQAHVDPSLTPKQDKSKAPQTHMLSVEEMEQVFRDMDENNVEPEKQDEDLPSLEENDDNIKTCNAAHGCCYVSPYGDVKPCIEYPLICGNIKEQPLKDIWQNSPEMQRIRSLRMVDLKTCCACDLRNNCRICPALNCLEENDIAIPARSNCERARAVRRSMQK